MSVADETLPTGDLPVTSPSVDADADVFNAEASVDTPVEAAAAPEVAPAPQRYVDYVQNIPTAATVAEVTEVFAPFGDIYHVSVIPPRRSKTTNIAFVEYTDPEAPARVLAAPDIVIHGAKLSVELSTRKGPAAAAAAAEEFRVFVGNTRGLKRQEVVDAITTRLESLFPSPSSAATDAAAQGEAGSSSPEAKPANSNITVTVKGSFAFVTLPTKEAAESAITLLNGFTTRSGTTLTAEMSTGKPSATEPAPLPSLYVRGLPGDVSPNDVIALFAPFGEVKSVEPGVVDGAVQHVFVDMDSTVTAQAAVAALNGSSVRGNVIRVEFRRAKGSASTSGSGSGSGNERRARGGRGGSGSGSGDGNRGGNRGGRDRNDRDRSASRPNGGDRGDRGGNGPRGGDRERRDRDAPAGGRGGAWHDGRDRGHGDRDREHGPRGHSDRGYPVGDRGHSDRGRGGGYDDRERDRGYSAGGYRGGYDDRDRGYDDRERDRGYGGRGGDRGYDAPPHYARGGYDSYDDRRGYDDRDRGYGSSSSSSSGYAPRDYDDRRGGSSSGYDDRARPSSYDARPSGYDARPRSGYDDRERGGYDDRERGDRGSYDARGSDRGQGYDDRERARGGDRGAYDDRRGGDRYSSSSAPVAGDREQQGAGDRGSDRGRGESEYRRGNDEFVAAPRDDYRPTPQRT